MTDTRSYFTITADVCGATKSIAVLPRPQPVRTADGFAVDPYSERLEELFVERCVRLHRLTPAQAGVALFVMRGYTYQPEIARLCGLAIDTVNNHLSKAYGRVGVSCITSLVAALWPDYVFSREEAWVESLW